MKIGWDLRIVLCRGGEMGLSSAREKWRYCRMSAFISSTEVLVLAYHVWWLLFNRHYAQDQPFEVLCEFPFFTPAPCCVCSSIPPSKDRFFFFRKKSLHSKGTLLVAGVDAALER